MPVNLPIDVCESIAIFALRAELRDTYAHTIEEMRREKRKKQHKRMKQGRRKAIEMLRDIANCGIAVYIKAHTSYYTEMVAAFEYFGVPVEVTTTGLRIDLSKL